MKWFVPREHGAWAMLVVPYLLGVIGSTFSIWHILFFVGLFGLYCATSPLLSYIRRPKLGRQVLPPLVIYSLGGAAFILPAVIAFPFLMILLLVAAPFLGVNLIFAKQKKERLFINDFISIIGFSTLVFHAFYIGDQTITSAAWFLFALSIIFFTASVFHVKGLIRERKNRSFHIKNYFFHCLIVAVPFVSGYAAVSVLFLPSLLRTVLIPRKILVKPMQIGIVEIVNSIVFVVLIIILYR